MRSWLFVPADNERKIEKALGAGADIVILDLEDSVAPEAKDMARANTARFLDDGRSKAPLFFVRINALDTAFAEKDLAAIMPGAPDGIHLPKSGGGRDVARLDAKLTAHEALCAIEEGHTEIAAIATETAAALFTLGTYAGASSRLRALAWGAEDLSAQLGASAVRDETGRLTAPYELARTLCLAGAVAAGAAPIDGIYSAYGDADGLRAECAQAARDGFTGKLAIHPAQVPLINAAFTPSAEEIAEATRIVTAFKEAGNPGVLTLDGKMFDRPHLKRAKQLLRRADACSRMESNQAEGRKAQP
jgi:citrate lyase subunit beta/citryl-CoA lyase